MINRRTVTRTTAWAVPAVALAAAAPAYAASRATIIGYTGAIKCPGNATDDPKRYVFTFTLDGEPLTGSITVTTLVINDVAYPVDRIIYEGTTIRVVSTSAANSADADGSGTITYTSAGLPATFDFTYNGTKSDPNYCRTLP